LELLAKSAEFEFFRGSMLAFADTVDHPCLKALGARQSLSLTLWAPLEGQEASSQWHKTNRSDQCTFRWTAEKTVTWEVDFPPPPLLVNLRIPFCAEINPDFAAKSLIMIGAKRVLPTVQTYNRIKALVSEIEVEGPIDQITMETPSPVTSVRDRRNMGVAVAISPIFADRSPRPISLDWNS
jgi:hypothetical protein